MNARFRIMLPVVLAMAVLVLTTPVTAQRVQPAVPGREALTILIRNSVIALNQANLTGNYTVLRDLAAPGFRATNSAASLAIAFTNLRNKKADLGAVVLLPPKLTAKPGFDSAGRLVLRGYFPSKPAQVQFQLVYQPVSGKWRLFGIAVDIATPKTQPVAGKKPSKGTKAASGRNTKSKNVAAKPKKTRSTVRKSRLGATNIKVPLPLRRRLDRRSPAKLPKTNPVKDKSVAKNSSSSYPSKREGDASDWLSSIFRN